MSVYATGTSGTIGKHLRDKVQDLVIDLSDKIISIPQKIFHGQDSVIHLAGIVGEKSVESNLRLSYRVNVESTAELGQQLRKTAIKKIVYVSTSHVYESSDRPLSEIDSVLPKSVYASQKRDAEIALADIFSGAPERLCIARVFSVLDWDVAPFTLGGGIAKLLDYNSDFVLSNGGDVRDFLTPKTVAGTLLGISQAEDLHGVVNVCSGIGISVKDAALTMLQRVSSSNFESRIDPGLSKTPYLVGDNSKLRLEVPHLDLSWVPSASVTEW